MSMTIAEKLVQDAENWQGVDTTKGLLFNSISAKGVTVPAGARLADTPALVDAIQTGGSPSEPVYHDVTFVDYDGTVISKQSILHGDGAITPAVVPLIEYTYVVGWLDDYSNVTDDLVVFIDRRLIDDTVTRIWLDLESTRTGLSVYVLFSVEVAGTVVIDYGDGYILSLPSGTAISTTTVPAHVYANGGNYMLTISGTAKISTNNSIIGLSSSSSYTGLIRTNNTTVDYAVTKAFFASNVTNNNYFRGHYNCKGILLPRLAPRLASDYITFSTCFYQAYSLRCLIIPDGVNGIPALDLLSPSILYIRFPDSWILSSGSNLNSSGMNSNSAYLSLYTYIRANWQGMSNIIKGINSYASTSNIKAITINVSQVNSDAFRNNKSLKRIEISTVVRKIGRDAFTNSGLESVVGDLSLLTHVYSNAFNNTPLRGDFYFPDAAQVNPSAFSNTLIRKLRVAHFVTGYYSSDYAISNVPLLEVLDYDQAVSVYSNSAVLYRATSMRAVIIRNTTPPTIGLLTWSRDTGSYNSFYDVYVPDEAWESYIVATNWVAIYNAGNLHKISEYVD
jgi:hypothetical protein